MPIQSFQKTPLPGRIKLLRAFVLRSWQKRLRSFNSYACWRGKKAVLTKGKSFLNSTPQYSSTLILNQSTNTFFLYFLDLWRLYFLYLPLRKAIWHIPLNLQNAFNSLKRGLGGLCYLKVQYKGKSFKWTRKQSSIVLRFGHSHLVSESFYPGIRMKRKGRMKLMLYGSSQLALDSYANRLCTWRFMNVYHGRGLRISRQHVLRKSGKVSAYR